jgi:hypothetical protein
MDADIHAMRTLHPATRSGNGHSASGLGSGQVFHHRQRPSRQPLVSLHARSIPGVASSDGAIPEGQGHRHAGWSCHVRQAGAGTCGPHSNAGLCHARIKSSAPSLRTGDRCRTTVHARAAGILRPSLHQNTRQFAQHLAGSALAVPMQEAFLFVPILALVFQEAAPCLPNVEVARTGSFLLWK